MRCSWKARRASAKRRARDEAQARQIAELAAQGERERALRAALIAALAIALAAALWLRMRELRRRQQALAASHRTLATAHQQLERESEALAIEASTDALTGTRSRRAILRGLRTALDHAQAPCSIVLFDLDHFKRINDEHGHPAGDAALRHASAVLMQEIGSRGSLGRYGGEGIPAGPAAAALRRRRRAGRALPADAGQPAPDARRKASCGSPAAQVVPAPCPAKTAIR
ncbi:MAG: GGDEF domain-containing protein [Rhodanobacteraceae bacterium]|nr:GGDEF domain-containing protein [Rhodanobacteraceae bacterium]